jgi:hypothetical protein
MSSEVGPDHLSPLNCPENPKISDFGRYMRKKYEDGYKSQGENLGGIRGGSRRTIHLSIDGAHNQIMIRSKPGRPIIQCEWKLSMYFEYSNFLILSPDARVSPGIFEARMNVPLAPSSQQGKFVGNVIYPVRASRSDQLS